ncbi:hypothetical protein [Tenacibaculum haliotis]|uniref:hypothetical protein n=1 Tax=Tenacibaculum haliotis TaxID=1888914 RepID=UPI0021AE9A89|nr:hypothetical protein [Tenacibaculum haliotis]MCT4697889.1 hypothetical protein [Tenacibaculum haliotis]
MANNYLQRNLNSLKTSNNTNYNLTPLQNWCSDCWFFFYKDLEKELLGKTAYVRITKGGYFMFSYACSKTTFDNQNLNLFIKIHQDTLTFCLSDNEEDNRKLKRDFFVKKILDKASDQKINVKEIGHLGRIMSLVKLQGDYRVKNKKDLMNLPVTIKILKNLIKLI